MTNGVNRGTNNEQHFREFLEKVNGHDWVVVRNMVGLDYEQQRNYTITLTAKVCKKIWTNATTRIVIDQGLKSN